MPRCGTNFLSNLLQLHPDCAPPNPVWEDFLVSRLDLLRQYSDSVSQSWDEKWGVTEDTQARLDASLGSGLTTFLQQSCEGARVISKTPRVENLELFFRFFPGSKLLVLVRDGRSVIESGKRTFGWHREPALHLIADSAATINLFRQNQSSCGDKFRILRYEDLWRDTEKQLRELLTFLQLDPDRYDFKQAIDLPVRGSSELTSEDQRSMHWDPVERTPEFDPMSRFANWSPAMHHRYNSVAGPAMEELGYRCKDVEGPAILYRLRGLLLDGAWLLRILARPFVWWIRRAWL